MKEIASAKAAPMRLRLRLLALAMAMLLALSAAAGCGGSGGGQEGGTTTVASSAATTVATSAATTAAAEVATTEQQPAAETGFVLNLCLASEPQTIDPTLNSSVDGGNMAQHMFEGLMKWKDDGQGNAVLTEGQCAGYEKETNADGTVTYTFAMRDGIKWSDGVPVVAQDFVNGLRRLANPETAADYAYIIDGIILNAGEIEAGMKKPEELGVEAPDDKTLKITLVGECPYFLELLAFAPLFPTRKDIIDEYGDQWTFDPATFISNGSYKMTAWEHNSYIATAKNEYYYNYENLGPDAIRFNLMDDDNAIYSAFRNGGLDFIEQVPVDELPGLMRNGEITVADYIGTYYMSFQVQKAPFDDKRVREAFTLAIDRNNIVENITGTAEKPASGFVPAGINDVDPSGPDFRTVGGNWYSVDAGDYEANCERARELLAEAGYPGGQGFPTAEYLYNTLDRHRAIAEAMQADWERELGVSVTIANQDWGVFLETRKNGDYQIARNGWIADYNDPISFLEMWVTGSGNNDAQYDNPAFNQLIADSRAAVDAETRMQFLHDAEKLMQDDFMLAPIYFYTQYYMLNPAVKGMYYTPLGYFLFNYATLA